MNWRTPKPEAMLRSLAAICSSVLVIAILFVILSMRTPNTNTGAVISVPSPIPSMAAPIAPATHEPTPVAVATPMPTASRVMDRDFGTWAFHAEKHGSIIGVGINNPATTIEEIRAYAEANRALLPQLANNPRPVEVVVTFRNFMPPDEFRAWALANEMHPVQSTLRVTQGNGQGGTAGIGAGLDGDPLPQSALDELGVNISEHPQGGGTPQMTGVYFTQGTLPASKLVQASADPRVYMVDVTITVVRNLLIADGWEGAAETKRIQLSQPSPFVWMEELGLENFR